LILSHFADAVYSLLRIINEVIPMSRERKVSTHPPYRTDLINAAMGARRLTNRAVAEKAGVGVMTVSKIRNGDPRVGYMTLKRVVEALGLTIAEVSEPRVV
jgi:helix-turn-helix protein